MKLIKEHINFERGLNPKDAMNVGDIVERIRQDIKTAITKLAKKYSSYEPDQIQETITDAIVKYGFYKTYDLETWEFYIAYRKLHDIFGHKYSAGWHKINETWKNRQILPNMPGGNAEYHLDNLNECIEELEKKLALTNESQHFERGLNPKDAMRIGMKQEIINWFENYSGIEFEEDGVFDFSVLLEYAIDAEIIEYVKYLVEVLKIPINIFIKHRASRTKNKEIIVFINKHYVPVKNKNIIVERNNFERGLNPKDAMHVGDIFHRTYEKGKKEIKEAIDLLSKQFKGIKVFEIQNKNPEEYIYEAGFYKTKTLTFFINYSIWFTGHPARISSEQYCARFSTPHNPNGEDGTSNDYCFDNLKDAVNTIRYWINDNIAKEYDWVEQGDEKFIEKWNELFIIESNFERGINSKKAMGIGFHRNFENYNDLCTWLIENMPLILKTTKIPQDILVDVDFYINRTYLKIIEDFISEFLTVKNKPIKGCWQMLWQKLYDAGYREGYSAADNNYYASDDYDQA